MIGVMGGSKGGTDELVQVLSPLAHVDAPSEELVQDVCRRLSDSVGALGIVVSALEEEGGKPWLLVASAAAFKRVCEAQFSLREGPCIEAYRHGELVWARCADATERWPRWVPIAQEVGIEAVVSQPVGVHQRGQVPMGTVWLALGRSGWLLDTTVRAASITAAVAIRQLAWHKELLQRRAEVTQLQSALGSRIVIEQAKGFIAARGNIPVDEAFERLRTAARSTQRRLHDVAGDVVQRGKMPSP